MTISEQIEQDFIAQLDKRLAPHRIGWPKLQCEPVFSNGSDVQVYLHQRNIQGILNEFFMGVDHIFQEAEISLQEGYLTRRYHRLEEINDSPMTLVLSADIILVGIHHLSAVLWRVKQECEIQNLGVAVEIIDLKALRGRVTRALSASETEITLRWGTILFELIAYLEKIEHEQGITRTSIDLLRHGFSNDKECRPTVVIGSPCADVDLWWDTGVQELKRVVSEGIEIEILYHKSIFD